MVYSCCMSLRPEIPDDDSPIMALHDRAIDNLAFIRDAMARSAPLTAVSGWGVVGMGTIALAGSYVAALRLTLDWWIYWWLAVACLGCLTGLISTAVKARRTNAPMFTQVLRKFALSLFPPIVAGIVLTEILYENSRPDLMPGTWLLLYGVGVVTGGAFSVSVLPMMGASFMVLSMGAFYPPAHMFEPMVGMYCTADVLLAVGFGGLHVLYGLLIALRYGG